MQVYLNFSQIRFIDLIKFLQKVLFLLYSIELQTFLKTFHFIQTRFRCLDRSIKNLNVCFLIKIFISVHVSVYSTKWID